MVLLYKGAYEKRTRPYSNYKSTKSTRFSNKYGSRRYDRAIAPALHTKGGPTSTQKPGAYALSVLDPEKSGPAIIPDISSYPTTTYSLRMTVPVSSSAVGVGGVKLNLTGLGQYFEENAATTTDGAFTYNAVLPITGASNIVTNYVRHRVVGASIRMEHTGNDQSNQGIVVGSSLTRFDTAAPPTTLINLQNSRTGTTVVAKEGIYVTYRPVDAACFDMQDTNTASVASSENFGSLLIHWSGCAANISMMVHITIHYEGIARLATGEGSTGGSTYTNAGELDKTMNATTGTDPVAPGSIYTDNSFSKAAQDLAQTVGDVVTREAILIGAAKIAEMAS